MEVSIVLSQNIKINKELQINGMNRQLGEAEQGRHEAEQRLPLAGNNTGADNYLKDELNKARTENIGLVEKTKELERKGKMLKSEKRERSVSVNKITPDMHQVLNSLSTALTVGR